MDGAVEYLLYRVIQRLEQQSHGNETLLKQVEQIAADITGNLPDLYLNGKFIYEDRLDEPGLRSAFLDRFGCTPHGFALQAKVDFGQVIAAGNRSAPGRYRDDAGVPRSKPFQPGLQDRDPDDAQGFRLRMADVQI